MQKPVGSVCSLRSFIVVLCLAAPLLGQPFSRDLRVDVTVNQVGFAPGAAKTCVLKERSVGALRGDPDGRSKVVFSGPLVESNGDFGRFFTGDFSGVRDAGTYYIKAGGIEVLAVSDLAECL